MELTFKATDELEEYHGFVDPEASPLEGLDLFDGDTVIVSDAVGKRLKEDFPENFGGKSKPAGKSGGKSKPAAEEPAAAEAQE